MRIKLGTIVLYSVLILFLTSCATVPTPVPTPTPKIPTWVATKSTGLYFEAGFESEMIGTLDVGEVLRLPDGHFKLRCETITEPNMTAELCYLYSPRLKLPGWVLSKWFEAQ